MYSIFAKSGFAYIWYMLQIPSLNKYIWHIRFCPSCKSWFANWAVPSAQIYFPSHALPVYMLQILVRPKSVLQNSCGDLELLTISLAYPRMHEIVECPWELWIYVLVGTGLSAYFSNIDQTLAFSFQNTKHLFSIAKSYAVSLCLRVRLILL